MACAPPTRRRSSRACTCTCIVCILRWNAGARAGNGGGGCPGAPHVDPTGANAAPRPPAHGERGMRECWVHSRHARRLAFVSALPSYVPPASRPLRARQVSMRARLCLAAATDSLNARAAAGRARGRRAVRSSRSCTAANRVTNRVMSCVRGTAVGAAGSPTQRGNHVWAHPKRKGRGAKGGALSHAAGLGLACNMQPVLGLAGGKHAYECM